VGVAPARPYTQPIATTITETPSIAVSPEMLGGTASSGTGTNTAIVTERSPSCLA
jgi:hypothetical protein